MIVDCFSFIRSSRHFCSLILFVIVGLGAGNFAHASQSVELTWTDSSSPEIVAYKVYFGTQSGQYDNSITFGDLADVLIPGLNSGQTYFFAVSAIDVNGNESPLSNETSYSVPGASSVQLDVQGTTSALNAAQLSWTASPDSDVYAYMVSYGTQSGVYTNSTTFYYTTSGVVSGLMPGATYYFVVAPVDSFGVEAASTEVAYSVPMPQALYLQAQSASGAPGVELDWNALTGEGIVAYNIYYGTESGIYTGSQSFYGGQSDVVIRGLTPGQIYYFVVNSVDGYGNESEFSNEAIAVASAPDTLQLQVQGSTAGIGAVQTSWTPSPDSDVYGYVVYYGTQSGTYDSSMDFFYTTNGIITGLTAGQTYYFAVASIDSSGIEPISSSEVAYTVPTAPPLVLQAKVPAGSPSVSLNWNTPVGEGIVGYNVYYGTQSGVYNQETSYSAVGGAQIYGLNGGQTYYFTVTSVDAYGNQSPDSNEAAVVAPQPQPMVLTSQVYSDGNGVPYAIEIRTDSTVYGSWEVDSSTNLQVWTPYAYGVGGGMGEGYDLDVYASIDPTQPPLYFRALNY
jgi:predicted RNase H-related nuclease YkuK (DUF458 family)